MPALTGRDIVLFTYSDWRASWSTPQQTAVRLAPHNRVLYIDTPRSFLFNFKAPDPQGGGQWSGPRLQEVRPNLYVYHPPHIFLLIGSLPFPIARLAFEINGRLLAALVKRQMAKLGMRDPLLWNFSPLHGTAVRHFAPALSIFEVADEWTSYVKHPSGVRLLQWIDERLTRSADVVFAGTENSAALREGLNPEIRVVHHAADYNHFSTAAREETPVPDSLARLPKPVIGSIGVMDGARFDIDLILHIAKARPNWSIVLVGPARHDVERSRFESCPNVYLTGNRQIAELPGYLKGMDVALIPYRVNEATRNIYPLKLQEYLAAGRPVVSAALPSVEPFSPVVRIADSHEDFITQIEAALKEDGPSQTEARQAVARLNSWEQRVEEKSAHILRVLAQRRERSA